MHRTLSFILLLFNITIGFAQSYNYEQAMDAMKQKDFGKALDYFSRHLIDNPQDFKALRYRAIIYKAKNENAKALSDINNAIKFYKKDKDGLAKAYLLRASIYSDINNTQNALSDYGNAIKLSPQNTDCYIDRAQFLFGLNQFEKSESDYRKVLKIDEGEVRAWAGLGYIYLETKKYDESIKVLTQLITLAPEYSSGYFFRSRVYYATKQYDKAFDDIFKCFQLDETDKQARSLLIESALKVYPFALSIINSQISNHPQKSIWYFIRAQLNEGKYNFEAAITDYTKVLELSDISFKSNLLSYRAKCYVSAGKYEQAITDFSNAVAIDSTNAYYFGYRADAKRLKADYNGAIIDFTKAIELEPRESWFYYRRGWTKEFNKDFEGALADYNEAIGVDKNYTYSYLNRGRLYQAKLNNSEKAKEDFNTILKLDTTIANQGNCRQYALFHLGNDSAAIVWLNKILSQYPTDGNYYDAACLYSLMNKPDQAIDNLQLAFKIGYRDFVHIAADDDLNNIRNNPVFIKLFNKWESITTESFHSDTVTSKLTEVEESIKINIKLKSSGIFEIHCKINELPLNLIFDTGASDISISQTEVLFMLKNDYLKPDDILGKQKYQIANGEIEEGTEILLRNVDIGGFVLKNVKASVIHNKNAPLLFGQSALSKYGKIEIDNINSTLTITRKKLQ